MDDLDYNVYNETRLIFLSIPKTVKIFILSFSLSFLFSFIFLHMVILDGDDCVKVWLVLLLVVLLTLLIYLGQSLLMADGFTRSILWDATWMSWVTLFLRVHEWWALSHPCLVFSILASLKNCFNTIFFSNLAHLGLALGTYVAYWEPQAGGNQVF